MYGRQEILGEIEQFRNDNPDDGEFYNVVADYIEQIQDEASGYRAIQQVKNEPVLLEIVPQMVLGIHVHKLIEQAARQFPHGAMNDHAAYHVASELDRCYKFYYKK